MQSTRGPRGIVQRETGYAATIKTISVRDLRQRWPEAEARLQVEKEIVITRDAKPIAKLVRIDERPKPRKRFDPAAHAVGRKGARLRGREPGTARDGD
jgi:antitoxin (DNA-binding transcriptional repressor) of toxin-antitoxin stability system